MEENYTNTYTENVYESQADAYTNAQNARPGINWSRAIVSMALGIFSCVYSIAAGIYLWLVIIVGLTFSILGKVAVPALTGSDFPSGIFSLTYGIGVIIFGGFAIAMALVSKFQNNKFIELYGPSESRMLRAGKITSNVGLYTSIAELALLVVVSIIIILIAVL